MIVWRFTGSRLLSEGAERRAQVLVAIQFFLLAPYVAYESIGALAYGERPDASWVGIGLALTSLMLMPALGRAKERIGERMGSVATKGEGQQNMLCAYLSAALLGRPAGQRAARPVVARPRRRPGDRRRRGQGGRGVLAGRGVLRAGGARPADTATTTAAARDARARAPG